MVGTITPEAEFIFFAVSVFAFGLAFGSFLNVCIYRLPLGLSVVKPGSACPNCNSPVKAYDNIPVLSWLILGGKCRSCKARITPRYLIVELLTAFLFLACLMFFGVTLNAFKYAVFCFLVLGLIFTDAEHKLLPDKMTLPGFALGLVFSLFIPMDGTLFLFYVLEFPALPAPEITAILVSLGLSLLGAAVGAFFIWGAGAAYKAVRGMEGMGFGDVKLMAMVGAFLGPRLAVFILILGSVMGASAGILAMLCVFAKRLQRRSRMGEAPAVARAKAWQSAQLIMRFYEIPFGVFLGISALIATFFGLNIVNWYVRLF